MSQKGYWLNAQSRDFLSQGYLSKGQTAEERISEIAKSAERILVKGSDKFLGFAAKFEDYLLRGWYSLSSPIWSNFGNAKGLPISCNGSYISDSMESILEKGCTEIGIMTKNGAGTSAYLGDLRPRGTPISRGGKANGPVHYARLIDCCIDVVSQSNIRRGSCAVYLPVEHPDIMEFLRIRSEGDPIQHLSFGVTISDAFMEKLSGSWEESDDDGKKAKEIFSKIIETRYATGYPYILFSDTVNENAPQVYKDKRKSILASNLCSEICLSSSEDESFVCNLSSMNLLHYEEWKDTDAVELLTYFLDAVMEEYIEKTKSIKEMAAAYNFAKNQRALGIGTLGWHSFLQSKMIPFESFEAKGYNVEIHRNIFQAAKKASRYMAEVLGEPELLKGYGERNVTVLAVAPTTSSSFILGQVSPSVEPLCDNYFIKDLAKGVYTYKNPYLITVLDSHGKNDAETWDSILKRGGSVQHLEFLTQNERDVFKTFGEISQLEVVTQAAQRQKWIDQSQSINTMLSPQELAENAAKLIIMFWKMKGKTLYYQRSVNPAQQLSRNIFACKSCEG